MAAVVDYANGVRDALVWALAIAGGSTVVLAAGLGAGRLGYRPGAWAERVLDVVARLIGFREDR